MPVKTTLEDGSEIETFTQEELDAQKAEAIEAFKAENPDKTEELTSLQTELEVANEELEKLKSVDKSVSHFKKEAQEAQKKVDEITKDIDAKINNVKREVLEGVMQDHSNEVRDSLSSGDDELKKKLEFEFNNTLKGVVPTTKEEITKKWKAAYTLAAKQEAPDAVNMNVFSSGGVGRVKINNSSQKFSPEEIELGHKFGLSDADFKNK